MFSAGAARAAQELRTGLPLATFAGGRRAVDRETDLLVRRLARHGLVEYRVGRWRDGEDQAVIEEVNRIGKGRIVLAGLWTSVCIVGPALSALGIITFTQTWNYYFQARVLLDQHEFGYYRSFFPPNNDPIYHEVSRQALHWINDIYGSAWTTEFKRQGEGFFHAQALADYLAAARNPDMIRGMCEDYRAAASIDLEHDRASRTAGAKVQCPLLVLWGSKGKIGQWYDAPAIWRNYCSGPVTGGAIDSGHYLAEEAPGAVVERFRAFFS
jgi:pimeloyl-ACP methyl ester carboxylesterase